ncbi:hypothetical protein E4U21_007050 [Claviceps maximensis]|nr:hypothetical protein E4U21_007050 [Claviceps maximensis]
MASLPSLETVDFALIDCNLWLEFELKTGFDVLNFPPKELWESGYFGIAHAEPGLAHAMQSLSLYRELYLKPLDLYNTSLQTEREFVEFDAIQHHDLALQVIFDDRILPNHMLSCLIYSVTFVCINMLKGDIAMAMSYLTSGLELIVEVDVHLVLYGAPDMARTCAILDSIKSFYYWLSNEAILMFFPTVMTFQQ